MPFFFWYIPGKTFLPARLGAARRRAASTPSTPSGETASGETESGETASGETESGETASGETESGNLSSVLSLGGQPAPRAAERCCALSLQWYSESTTRTCGQPARVESKTKRVRLRPRLGHAGGLRHRHAGRNATLEPLTD
jgi:hypothetical protein